MVRKWHYGKLIILWSWGGLVAALLLTQFMTQSVANSPLTHLLEIGCFLIIVVTLSVLTWHWLGGKESS
jgi:quinol-cytochrome oxidoreductase complex cytochrome b subunit